MIYIIGIIALLALLCLAIGKAHGSTRRPYRSTMRGQYTSRRGHKGTGH